MYGLTELQIINIAAAYSANDNVQQRTAINNDRLDFISKELQEHAVDQDMKFEDYVDQVAKD